jgi:UDP-3-O-[3-hydroxymyristoyl] glucosamine N-acyltransferase
MSDIVILGAGRFALELATYLQDIEPSAVVRHLAVQGEVEGNVAPAGPWPAQGLENRYRYVLGVADIALRQTLIDAYFSDGRLSVPNFIHPSVRHRLDLRVSRGNVIAADCHVGINTRIGSWNMINYHCSVGHHSQLGDNNFLSPHFNAGNSITLGSRCFIGLSTVVTPQTVIEDDVTVQAGCTLSECIPAHSHCTSTARQKILQLV